MNDIIEKLLSDGGTKSRKFLLAIFAMLLVSLMLLLSAQWKALDSLYSTFVGGIIGIYAIYAGANQAGKFFVSKTIVEDKKKKES